jgi:hypothetical protein
MDMDIGSAFATKYLKASDLQGRDVTVKMGRVEQEKVGDDQKLILYFQGKEKGMVLNKTNANSIADVYGGETNDWYGQTIILFEQMVDFQGKRVPGLRIRAPRRDAPARQSAPRREVITSGDDDFPVDRSATPRRAVGGISDNMDRVPARNEDMNDDIPF